MIVTTEEKKIDTDIQLQSAVGGHYWTSGAEMVFDTYVERQLNETWRRIDELEVQLQARQNLADYEITTADFLTQARGW